MDSEVACLFALGPGHRVCVLGGGRVGRGATLGRLDKWL